MVHQFDNIELEKHYVFFEYLRKKFPVDGNERIEKEYYPDNGLKITRGITRIILTESGNCKYSWEVYDTTLLGKTRISYFITKSDNPEDSTISIKLIGTDEF